MRRRCRARRSCRPAAARRDDAPQPFHGRAILVVLADEVLDLAVLQQLDAVGDDVEPKLDLVLGHAAVGNGESADALLEARIFGGRLADQPGHIVARNLLEGVLTFDDERRDIDGGGDEQRDHHRQQGLDFLERRHRASKACGPGSPGPCRSYFTTRPRDLPDRAAVELLALQVGRGVVGIDDEQRPLVADRHVFAVALEREDGLILGEVFDRDLARIVVQRDRDDTFAVRADRLHQLVERHAFELHRLLVPGRLGLELDHAERFQGRRG